MNIRFRAVSLAALILFAGCSEESSVSGKVTFDGTLLKTGTVMFHPTGSGPVGTGSIGDDGRYTVALGSSKTLPPGEYIVTVVSTEPTDKEAYDPKGRPLPPKAPKRITPGRYANKDSSDLRATIKSGNNVVNLELKK